MMAYIHVTCILEIYIRHGISCCHLKKNEKEKNEGPERERTMTMFYKKLCIRCRPFEDFQSVMMLNPPNYYQNEKISYVQEKQKVILDDHDNEENSDDRSIKTLNITMVWCEKLEERRLTQFLVLERMRYLFARKRDSQT